MSGRDKRDAPIVFRKASNGCRRVLIDDDEYLVVPWERMGSRLWKIMRDGEVVGYAATLDRARSVIRVDQTRAERWNRGSGS